jgi:hypothetical protein
LEGDVFNPGSVLCFQTPIVNRVNVGAGSQPRNLDAGKLDVRV